MTPRMPQRPPTFRPHRPQPPRPDHRPSAHKRGYGRAWWAARLAYLRAHPLCVRCQRQGRLTPATVVDHVTPHKGDMGAFWQREWQGLCKRCHDAKTALEDGGFGNRVAPKREEE